MRKTPLFCLFIADLQSNRSEALREVGVFGRGGSVIAPNRTGRGGEAWRKKQILGARIAIPGSPYRGQNWKIRKMTFLGSKSAFFGGSPQNHLNGFLGH